MKVYILKEIANKTKPKKVLTSMELLSVSRVLGRELLYFGG
jgi:hypothetical protein